MKPKIDDKAFGARVEKIAEIAGGVGKLAKKSRVSTNMLKKYISGYSDPSRQTLIALAEAVDVMLEWLATGNGSMYTKKEPQAMEERQAVTALKSTFQAPSGDLQLVYDAFHEVMSSKEKSTESTRLILIQNVCEFRDKIREKIESERRIAALESDLEAIKRHFMPRKTDFKTQGQPGKRKRRTGGGKD